MFLILQMPKNSGKFCYPLQEWLLYRSYISSNNQAIYDTNWRPFRYSSQTYYLSLGFPTIFICNLVPYQVFSVSLSNSESEKSLFSSKLMVLATALFQADKLSRKCTAEIFSNDKFLWL